VAALTEPQPRLVPFRWKEHGARVLEFQYEVYQCNFPGFQVGQGFLADYERQLRAALRNPYEALWVIEEAGCAQAFLWAAVITTLVDEKLGYIKNVYVSPARRRLGWGRLLIARAESWMESLGVDKSSLDVTADNETAVALYRGCGYEVQRFRMEKRLGGPRRWEEEAAE
jgi:ribosomal protein S18 acetylase RimI-like enzyme